VNNTTQLRTLTAEAVKVEQQKMQNYKLVLYCNMGRFSTRTATCVMTLIWSSLSVGQTAVKFCHAQKMIAWEWTAVHLQNLAPAAAQAKVKQTMMRTRMSSSATMTAARSKCYQGSSVIIANLG